jgi:hypothetical protein
VEEEYSRGGLRATPEEVGPAGSLGSDVAAPETVGARPPAAGTRQRRRRTPRLPTGAAQKERAFPSAPGISPAGRQCAGSLRSGIIFSNVNRGSAKFKLDGSSKTPKIVLPPIKNKY